MSTLLLGPILGYESDPGGAYYTSLIVTTDAAPVCRIDGTDIAFQKLTEAATVGAIWRAEWLMPVDRPAGRQVGYATEASGEVAATVRNENYWIFYLPASNESIRFVYGSCNGFSALKLMAITAEPHKMWERMVMDHATQPLSLIVLGGDQVNADAVWEQEWMRSFTEMTDEQMRYAPVSAEMEASLL